MTTHINPAHAAVLRTEARLFGREWGSLFWILLFPTALLCILGAIPGFRRDDPALGGMSVIDLYVPTAILLSMIMAAIMAMPPVVFAYRESGVLRRLGTTPVGASSILLAQVALHTAAVVGSSILALVVGRLAFGTPFPHSWSGYVLAYLLTLVAAFSIGAALTALSPTGRVGTAVGTVVFFVAMFTSGVWLPVQAMPEALREVLAWTPLSAAAEAMTQAVDGGFPDPVHLLVIAVWGAVLSFVAVRTFRWE
ncbi:MAG TPA: ABC transporter permease [Actinomycetales bacterium]|nr:ABC transporter permease [Actinomycetales bacterium]